MKRIIIGTILLILTTSVRAESLNEWVNKRIQAQIAKKRDPATQQIDPPAALAPKANLADLTSATDFVSLAAGFAGIGDDPNEETQSVTINAYTLYAGANGDDPADLAFRSAHPQLQRWFLTLGTKQAANDKPAARSYQVKHLAYDGRRLSETERQQLQEKLVGAASSEVVTRVRRIVRTSRGVMEKIILPEYRTFLKNTGGLSDAAIDARAKSLRERTPDRGPLLPHEGDTQAEINLDRTFWIALNTGMANVIAVTRFDEARKLLSEEDVKAVDAAIARELEPFLALDETAMDLVSKMRRRAQISWTATLVDIQSDLGRKSIEVQGIWARGLSNTINLTLNGTYVRPEGNLDANNDDSLKVAAQLRKQLRSVRGAKRPLFLDIAADTALLVDKRIWRAQAKATLPIVAGLQVPISVTWANRDELVDESNVAGHIGISFDFSNIASFFNRSAE